MGICLEVWDNSEKSELIPDSSRKGKDLLLQDEPAYYQLVGGVKAYQGDDG